MLDVSPSTVISFLALLAQVITVISGVAWGIARIRTTTEILRASVEGLRETLSRLDRTVSKLDDELRKLDNRLTTVETLQNHNRRGQGE